jgi:superfamily II DNA or RNA helicase
MDSIIVRKKNEAFLEIDCDAGIAMELAEHFSFYVPGYKFMPSYRNRMWDGKIRLFDLRKRTLYCGLFHYIEEFADIREYTIVVEDNSYYSRPNTQQIIDMEEFLKTLTLTSSGVPITPHDYQYDSVELVLSNTKQLLLSPTASGKSLIIYMAIRYYLEMYDNNVLIIVPTTSLVEQLYSDFADYSQFDKWDAEANCHKIYSGKDKHGFKERVVISTWQSIYKMPATWFEGYGMVVGDEAHAFKAKSLTSILEKCTEAKYRLGTTGTLDGTQTHQLVLEGLFGPVHKVTTTKKLIDDKKLAQLDINVILLKYKDEYCRAIKSMKYPQEIDFIVDYEPRNNFITNLALDQDGNTLILFQYVKKHGKPLYKMVQEKTQDQSGERKIFYVSGETDVDTREEIRAITEKENNAIIVASLGTFSTGINIKRLHNIIFASPSKSQIRVLQSIGRGLRKTEDGINTIIYDIADDLHWKNRKNYTLKHAGDRIAIYSKEKFNYKIHEVPI